MIDINETPVTFGPEQSLVGMLAMPGTGDPSQVGCLMMNMGANHRIGPRRINVKLARRLAECGLSSLRMDLAGLGDSGPPKGSEHFQTQAIRDLQAGMDLMQARLGIQRFLVIGLCSGAGNGLAVASNDSRVAGLLMFDGDSFMGQRARLERGLRRALAAVRDPAVAGKAARWLQRQFSSKAAQAMAPSIYASESPAAVAAKFRRDMQLAADRKVALMLVYTGTNHVVDRGRDQLGAFATEPFARTIEYRFVPEIDHSLTSLESQEIFIRLACDWALRATQPRTAAPVKVTSPSRTSASVVNRIASGRTDTVY